MEKVSIIIPTYEQNGKGAHFLKLLLNSINRQDYTGEVEVIISDNSKNNSIFNLVRSFEMRKYDLKYFRNSEKRGVGENTNYAIEKASFPIIKPMYMDDVFLLIGALGLFVSAVRNAGWVISNSLHLDEVGQVIAKKYAVYNHSQFDIHNRVGMPSVTMFRKSGLRMDTRLKTMVDVAFYRGLYQEFGQPANIYIETIGQRFHDNSISSLQENRAENEWQLLRKEERDRLNGMVHNHFQ